MFKLYQSNHSNKAIVEQAWNQYCEGWWLVVLAPVYQQPQHLPSPDISQLSLCENNYV